MTRSAFSSISPHHTRAPKGNPGANLNVSRHPGRSHESIAPGFALRFARGFPAVNLYDTSSHYFATVELPGLSTCDFELSFTGDTLTLRGNRLPHGEVRDESYRRQERPFGPWSRSITLPTKVDAERIRARLSLGVLTVELPKLEDVPTRQISVTTDPA